MKLNASRLGRTVFNSAAALALGFGAMQALATPASASTSAANARICDPNWCDEQCVANGASGGFCVSRFRCECY